MSRHRAIFDKLIGLVGMSLSCLLVLAGAWAYSGSFLPSTDGFTAESLTIWLIWSALVVVPLVTASAWFIAARRHERSND